MLWRGARGARRLPGQRGVGLGLFGADRPAEPGELTCRSDRADRAAFVARLHSRPAVVQHGAPERSRRPFGSADQDEAPFMPPARQIQV